MAGPRLHDQVVGLPEALLHPGGSMIAGGDLVGHAADESALQATARVHVDHRHLFGHPHGLAPVRDRIAQDQQPRLARVARERAHDDRGGRVQVRRGLVMLVHHDLEAEVLGDLPLVDEAVVEVGADLGVVVAVGQLDPDRVVLALVGQQVVRVLAEEPGPHDVPPTLAHLRETPAPSRRAPRAARDGGNVRPGRWSRAGRPGSSRGTPPRS